MFILSPLRAYNNFSASYFVVTDTVKKGSRPIRGGGRQAGEVALGDGYQATFVHSIAEWLASFLILDNLASVKGGEVTVGLGGVAIEKSAASELRRTPSAAEEIPAVGFHERGAKTVERFLFVDALVDHRPHNLLAQLYDGLASKLPVVLAVVGPEFVDEAKITLFVADSLTAVGLWNLLGAAWPAGGCHTTQESPDGTDVL
jgi:hypothetical protein